MRIEQYRAYEHELKINRIFNLFLITIIVFCIVFLGLAWRQTKKEVTELDASQAKIERQLKEIGYGIDVSNDKLDAVIFYTRPEGGK